MPGWSGKYNHLYRAMQLGLLGFTYLRVYLRGNLGRHCQSLYSYAPPWFLEMPFELTSHPREPVHRIC